MEEVAFALRVFACVVGVISIGCTLFFRMKEKDMLSQIEKAGAGGLKRKELVALAGFFAELIRSLAEDAKKPSLLVAACADVYEDAGLAHFLDRLPGDEVQRANAAFFAVAAQANINGKGRKDFSPEERYDFIGLGTATLMRSAALLGLDAPAGGVRRLTSEAEWREYVACYKEVAKVAGGSEAAVQAGLERRFAALPVPIRLAVIQSGWEPIEAPLEAFEHGVQG